MLRKGRLGVRLASTIAAVLVLAGVFYLRAQYNVSRIDYRNSNFVFFWLAGRMVVHGENPYDAADWTAANAANDVQWRPDLIFPYPLPLSILLAPLGLLPLEGAYFGWQFLSEMLIALAIWLLLRRQGNPHHTRMLVPLCLMLIFFGPVYLTLQIGALGAIMLAAVVLAIIALEHDRPLLAGVLLSLTLLKPPQAMPLLALAAIWLVARRAWKAVLGLGLGTACLFLIGLLADTRWPAKFITAGQAVMEHNLGLQANVVGLAYSICSGDVACMWDLGGSIALIILAACSFYLWRKRAALSAWQVFNLITPVAFLATFYLWSYDQVLYIIPIVWIVLQLIDRTRTYWAAFLFLGVLVLASLVALLFQARTGSDVLSLLTTTLVLGGVAALFGPRQAGAKANQSSA